LVGCGWVGGLTLSNKLYVYNSVHRVLLRDSGPRPFPPRPLY